MQVTDVEAVRTARREMARHKLDTTETQVGVSHGVVHLFGKVRPTPGAESVFTEEINSLYKCLKSRPGVRDVMMDWETEMKVDGLTTKVSLKTRH